MEEIIQRHFWKKLQQGGGGRVEYSAMSAHPYLKTSMIERYPDHPWNWYILSRSPHAILVEKLRDKEWDWTRLTETYCIDRIIRTPWLPWNEGRLIVRLSPSSVHHCIRTASPDPWLIRSREVNLQYILSHPTLPWVWAAISRRNDVLLDHAFSHPHLAWDISYLCRHGRFGTSRFRHPFLNYRILSQNPHLHRTILHDNIERPWDWTALALHPAFPPRSILVDRTLYPRWRWDHSLSNPRLDVDAYDKIRKKFTIHNHFSFLCRNHFDRDRRLLPYFRIVQERFLHGLFRRATIKKMIRLLRDISERLSSIDMYTIMRFV